MNAAGMPSARCAAGAGLASAVVGVVAAAVAPLNPPHANAAAQEIARWLADHRSAVLLSNSLFGVSFVALLGTFIAALYVWFRVTAPDARLATTVMLVGGVVAVAMIGVFVLLGLASTWLAGSDVDPSTLKALYEGNLLANVAAGLPTAVFLIGFGFAVSHHASMPAWARLTAFLLAAIHTASAFALARHGALAPSGLALYVPPLAFTVWMAAVSIVLARGRVRT